MIIKMKIPCKQEGGDERERERGGGGRDGEV
jgi:hypothetical protein